ncbi:MAG: hypothetical protein M3430_03610, partial [Acidobacteriota bacterium]|nr:hypothetical protein [Acidobacteriota bacterium]
AGAMRGAEPDDALGDACELCRMSQRSKLCRQLRSFRIYATTPRGIKKYLRASEEIIDDLKIP